MASFDKDGVSPALQVAIIICWSRFNCWFQAKSVLDAFEELNESEETKKVLLGYMTRATVAERTFSSQGGYTVVPDEESKKLIINQAVERDGETFFICHKCDDLTSFYNAKDINIKEMDSAYVELQDQWNGPYIFFLKSIAQPPVNETAPIFFLGEFSHNIIML